MMSFSLKNLDRRMREEMDEEHYAMMDQAAILEKYDFSQRFESEY